MLLIHGMGSHTPGSFLGQFNTTMEAACKLYPSLSTKTFADYVAVKAIGYNHFFEEYRNGQSNKERFNQLLTDRPAHHDLKKAF